MKDAQIAPLFDASELGPDGVTYMIEPLEYDDTPEIEGERVEPDITVPVPPVGAEEIERARREKTRKDVQRDEREKAEALAAEDADAQEPTKVLLTRASSIAMKGTRWLYKGRVPQGMVTLLAGREGIGKSTVALDLAARITKGTLDGRYFGKPQNVVICATEDSWSHTIVPRLLAVGADLTRVFHIAVQDEEGNTRAIVAPGDTRRMALAFAKLRPALMIIDPLMAILDGKVDSHKQQDVQQALEPMVKMCDRLDMSVLALIHVNKSGGTDPLNSIMGSKAFATLPRSILYCIADADVAGSFMFCHPKCNVGPTMPSIAYRISSVRFDLPAEEVEEGDDPWIESNRIVWGDIDTRTAADVMQEAVTVSTLGNAANDVLTLINNEPGVIDKKLIYGKLEQHEKKAIDNALHRLAGKDRIDHVGRGLYQSVRLPSSTHLSGD